MSTEIRKLKDGSTTVLPLTVGSAVNLDDGTTVQDLADRSNKNQIKLNRDEPMRVVVAKCMPAHPKIGMRYYYHSGVFGVRKTTTKTGEFFDDFDVYCFNMDSSKGDVGFVNISYDPEDFKGGSYFALSNSTGNYYDKKLRLLLTICESTDIGSLPIGNTGIYAKAVSTPDLNCDTYSPYLKVINGHVVNVENIDPPTKCPGGRGNALLSTNWPWFDRQYGSHVGIGSKYHNLLKSCFKIGLSPNEHNQHKELYIDGHSVPSHYNRYYYYNYYRSIKLRKKNNHPMDRKKIKVQNILSSKYPRSNDDGRVWVPSKTYWFNYNGFWIGQNKKRPYKIIGNICGICENVNVYYAAGKFSIRTIRRRRLSVNNIVVKAVIGYDVDTPDQDIYMLSYRPRKSAFLPCVSNI